MGIKQLMKLVYAHCPQAVTEHPIPFYFGRTIGIDASMALYQFLIAVRQDGVQLATDSGEVTSHLQGLLSRTSRMMSLGLRPVYVFDGKPPEAKMSELALRKEHRELAAAKQVVAKEAGDDQAFDKFARRQVRVTHQHNEEAKQLLHLMGLPYVEAAGEAEAQCSALVKQGVFYATGSEDMDSLPFGSPILLRNLTFSEARKLPIREIRLDKVLEGLGLNQAEFVDLCILCGCDYCRSIHGIGHIKAYEFIKKWKTIEGVLKHLDPKKYPLPDPYPYERARELFVHPDIADPATIHLRWTAPDVDGLIDFLVKQKQFDEKRVRNAIARLVQSKKQSNQGRLDAFLRPKSLLPPSSSPSSPAKRPAAIVEDDDDDDDDEKPSTSTSTASTSTSSTSPSTTSTFDAFHGILDDDDDDGEATDELDEDAEENEGETKEEKAPKDKKEEEEKVKRNRQEQRTLCCCLLYACSKQVITNKK
nr:Flap endonuclease 1 [Paratrimastix eleionoma]